jgi:hypothetical protein
MSATVYEQYPFPKGVQVVVLNKNDDWNFERLWGGDLYQFPPGKAVTIDAEAAWNIFCFETRRVDKKGNHFRDYEGGGSREEASYYKQVIVSTGLTNDDPINRRGEKVGGDQWMSREDKLERFDNFTFKVLKSKKQYTAEEFAKI